MPGHSELHGRPNAAGILRACLVSPDKELRAAVRAAWPADRAEWTFYETGREAVGALLVQPPNILLCGMDLPDMTGLQVTRLFTSENVYTQVPVLLCLSGGNMLADYAWGDIEVDDFLLFPCPKELLRARLDLAFSRSERALDANPLTRLPGNTSIIRYTQKLIDVRQDFALAYCDLDHFKPFNDKYGFVRGDEVLMMTSRILLNTVKSGKFPFSFVGHVGGDDFVAIVPLEAAEDICKAVITAFDAIVPHFYDEEDRRRGGIVSTNRQGAVQSFPSMGISIAVVFNRQGSLAHYGEASHIAMGLKKKAKEVTGSGYVLDKRGRLETAVAGNSGGAKQG